MSISSLFSYLGIIVSYLTLDPVSIDCEILSCEVP